MAVLAAVLIGWVLPAGAASTTQSVDPTANLPYETNLLPYEIRMAQTPRGGEGLEFAARLAADGGLIMVPIEWKVRRSDGETVYSRAKPVAAFDAEPGDYIVEAVYGPARIAEAVTLIEGQRLGITFIFNIGGIRVLPRLEGLGVPPARSLTSVYAMGGRARGKLVAMSENPGEILRLNAGRYRIESRFTPGNAVTSTEVSVKPGLMSAVEIDHHAGLARLAMDAPASDDIVWRIVTPAGTALPRIAGSRAEIVLAPGTYRISASAGENTWSRTVTIEAGKTEIVEIRR